MREMTRTRASVSRRFSATSSQRNGCARPSRRRSVELRTLAEELRAAMARPSDALRDLAALDDAVDAAATLGLTHSRARAALENARTEARLEGSGVRACLVGGTGVASRAC